MTVIIENRVHVYDTDTPEMIVEVVTSTVNVSVITLRLAEFGSSIDLYPAEAIALSGALMAAAERLGSAEAA